MSTTINWTETFHIQNCIECGMAFGFPRDFDARLRETKRTFYCPTGHPQAYLGETEAEKLRKQVAAKDAELARKQTDIDFWRTRTTEARTERDHEKSRARALRGVATRQRKQAALARCPCCDKRFSDVAAHLNEKHPDWTKRASGAQEKKQCN